MSKAQHTPGPWIVLHEPTLNTYHVRVEDLDTAPIASLFYSSGGSRPQLCRELIDANARLIAAAPDLLAACEEVSGCIGEMPELVNYLGQPVIDRLRTAIDKAKGTA